MKTINIVKITGWRKKIWNRFAGFMLNHSLATEYNEQVYEGHGNIGLIQGVIFFGKILVIDYEGQ